MAKKKKQEQVVVTPQMQNEFNRFKDVFGTPAPSTMSTPTASEIDTIYNQTKSMGNITADEIDNIYNATLNEMNATNQSATIPTLQPTVSKNPTLEELQKLDAPMSKEETYKHNFNNAIGELQNQLLDTTAKRTEGETKAIEEYLAGLQGLQGEVDRYNRANAPKSISSKNNTYKNGSVSKNETLSTKSSRELAEEKGRMALQNAQNGSLKAHGYSLSPNEQRDLERAMNAQTKAYKEASDKHFKSALNDIRNKSDVSNIKKMALPYSAVYDTEGNVNTDLLPTKTSNVKNRFDVAREIGTSTADTSDEAFVEKALSSDKKLDKIDIERANNIIERVSEENPKIKDALNTNESTMFNAILSSMSDEEKIEYQRMATLKNKTSKKSAFVLGATNSTPMVDKALDKANELAGGDERYNFTNTVNNVKEQNPFTYGAGVVTGALASNIGAQQLLKGTKYGSAITKLMGGEKASATKKLLADALMDAPVDLGLDIIPNLANDISNGEDTSTVLKNLGINTATNVGLNLGAAALANPQLTKEALRNGKGNVTNLINELNGTNARNRLINNILDNTDDVKSIPNINKKSAEDMREAGLDNYIMGDEGETTLFSQLNPTTNSGANKIIENPQLKQMFEQENGVTLTGSKAEQRKQIFDIVENNRNNNTVADILNNTDEVNPIPRVNNINPDDATEMFRRSQLGLDDTTSQIKNTNMSVDELREKMMRQYGLQGDEAVKEATEQPYRTQSNGQIAFTDVRGNQIPPVENVAPNKLSLGKINNVLSNSKNTDNIKNVAPTGKSFLDETNKISDEAYSIYEKGFQSNWDNLINNADQYKSDLYNYVKAFGIDDTGIEGAEANRIIDTYMKAVEDIKSAQDYNQLRDAYRRLDGATFDLNDLLEGKTLTEVIPDEAMQSAYNDIIDLLKGKTINIPENIKAEFPDGVFDMNKFGSNIRFSTKKGVTLDEMPDVKEALRGVVDIEGDNDVDAQRKLFDFLLNAKDSKTMTREVKYTPDYLVEIAQHGDELMRDKANILGYTKEGNKLATSRMYTNTGARQGATDVQYAKNFKVDDFSYVKRNEKSEMTRALRTVNNNDEDTLIKMLDNAAEWTADETDVAMLMNRRYIQEAQALEEAGEDATEVWRKANSMLRRVQRESTREGQALQALAKWSRNTPEGQLAESIAKARQTVDKKYFNGFSKTVDAMGEQLEKILLNTKDPQKAIEEVNKLLSYNLQTFANKFMGSANGVNPINISGSTRKDIVRRIKDFNSANGETLTQDNIDEIVKTFLKDNRVANINAVDEINIFKSLSEAQALENAGKKGTREWKVARANAMKIIEDSLPESTGEKVKTLLYDNMLASLKTTITRNLGSNVIYNTLEDSTKWEKALLDKGVGLFTGRRSHTITPFEATKEGAKGFVSGASDTIKDFVGGTKTVRSGEETIEDALDSLNTAFHKKKGVKNAVNNLLYYYDKTVQGAMELGDRPIYEKTFAATKKELEEVVRKYGEDGLRLGTDQAKTAQMSADELIGLYSRNEALRSVMQNKSDFTDAMSNLKSFTNKLTKGLIGSENGVLGQATMPFTQVPANMLDRMVEYIPVLGMARNIKRTKNEIKTLGAMNQRRFVDELSHQINGSLLMGGATYLGSKGLISDAYSEDADKKKLQQANDYQEYALQGLNIPQLGITPENQIDISDVPIIGGMLQAGKRISNAIDEHSPLTYDENGNVIDVDEGELIKAIAEGTGGAIEGTMADTLFQGINRLTGADAKYSSSNGLIGNVGNAIASSTNQIIPSFVRQYAQYKDPYKRDLGDYGTQEYYTNLFNNSLPGNWELSDFEGLNQIPILQDIKGREAMPVKKDTAGQNILQGSGEPSLKKAWETFAAPYKVSTPHYTETYNEAERLENALGDLGAYTPQLTKGDLTKVPGYDVENYSHEDLYNMRNDYAEMIEQGKKDLYASSFYQKLSDEEKLDVNKQLNSAYKVLAKENVPGSTYSSDSKLAQALKGGKTSMIKYFENWKNNEETKAAALDSGFVKKDGTANVATYQHAVDIYGNNKMALTKYSNLYDELSNKNLLNKQSDYIPYLSSKGNMSDAEKGQALMVLAGKTPEDIGSAHAQDVYDNYGGYASLYKYYLYKTMADNKQYGGNGNGSLTKAELIDYLVKYQNLSKSEASNIYAQWYK